MENRIAFFDFDGTITRKDTMLEFIRHSKGSVRFYTGFLLNSPWLIAYKLGLLPNQTAKERILTHFFKGTPLTVFQEECDQFCLDVLPGLVRPGALPEIEKLQQADISVVIVSASLGNWIKTWSDGKKTALLASWPEIRDGRLTGKLQGKNCYGEEKVKRIQASYALQDYTDIYAYGDTSGDLPMLSLARFTFFKPFR
ncbi:MAG TPA: HAD-IB family hydrolase [Puia sp.]|nr:HAD-IB family hydrolase [Puia sp.]